MAALQLFDQRMELWRRSFEQALSFDRFIAQAEPAHRERWARYREQVALSAAQHKLLSNFTRTLNVLVLAGTWCGDCARQCPMLAAISAVTPKIDLRFVDNQSNVELRDELRIHGAARVPATIVLSEDMFEVSRASDRTLSVYRRKAQNELGAACDAGIVLPPADELALELNEWVEYFERAHLLLRVSPFLRTRHND